ncbi:MAG: hypothetical protein J5533_07815 [Bacteroidales bacterium]|nr:hypothetical protein [Bacteroidales bacterium]
MSLALCGSMFAQYTSHWADDFYAGDYEDYGILVAAIMIDGNMINIGFMVCQPEFIDRYIEGDSTVLEKAPPP